MRMGEPPEGPGVLACPLCSPKDLSDPKKKEVQSRNLPTSTRTTEKSPGDIHALAQWVVTTLENCRG